jgi:IS1 family transposase
MDELWSIVGDTSRQYWLWWAIDHHTGEPLAFHFGTWEYKYLGEFLSLLRLFVINSIYTEHTYTYLSGVTESEVVRGKESRQKIEGGEEFRVRERAFIFPKGNVCTTSLSFLLLTSGFSKELFGKQHLSTTTQYGRPGWR